jgi:hypothetical protein
VSDVRGGGPALDDLERTWDRHYAAALRTDTAAGIEIDRLRRLQNRSRITVQESARLDVLLKRAQQSEGARARLGDGSRMMLDTLAGLDFTGLDLVTLSACQTAMSGGQTDDGREIEGLSTIVQQRGARQVVASLWRVEDESTAQLMRAMYLALAAR